MMTQETFTEEIINRIENFMLNKISIIANKMGTSKVSIFKILHHSFELKKVLAL